MFGIRAPNVLDNQMIYILGSSFQMARPYLLYQQKTSLLGNQTYL